MSTHNAYISTNVDAAITKGDRKANVGVNTPPLFSKTLCKATYYRCCRAAASGGFVIECREPP